jgi:DNA-directed RNA polymerase specialized sigma24 family protein
MEISNSDYLRYKKMANVICNYDMSLSEDLLHDTLLYFIEKKVNSDKINDNYIFMSLKNRFTNLKTRGKKFDDIDIENLPLEDNKDEYRLEIENNNFNKLLSIKKNISLLNDFEKQLFTLIIIKNVSQVDICRKSNLSESLLSMRFKKIKEKLRDGKV